MSLNSTQNRTILLDLLPVKTPAFGGPSKLYLSSDTGNEATLVLPTQQDERTGVDRVKPTAA